MKVLVVDDWEDFAILLRRWVATIPNGASVEQVLDVPDAMPAMQRVQPHVVILDNRLPSGSGLGLIQTMKQSSPATVVIMFTGYVDEHTEKTAKELGADYFFCKNADLEKLVNTLSELAGKVGSASATDA